ncbi:hypothetical protein CHU98_g6220 [Xylaria longipes]|nr:hypothetical protein CHU98_g6220 [Xylaria longipes]
MQSVSSWYPSRVNTWFSFLKASALDRQEYPFRDVNLDVTRPESCYAQRNENLGLAHRRLLDSFPSTTSSARALNRQVIEMELSNSSGGPVVNLLLEIIGFLVEKHGRMSLRFRESVTNQKLIDPAPLRGDAATAKTFRGGVRHWRGWLPRQRNMISGEPAVAVVRYDLADNVRPFLTARIMDSNVMKLWTNLPATQSIVGMRQVASL